MSVELEKQKQTNLMRLYECICEEERYYISEQHRRLMMYLGLLGSLFTGIIVGLFNAEQWYEFASLSFGCLIVLGIAWPWIGKLPIGRLPGDIIINKPGLKIYFPITTMVIISIIISVLVWIFRK